MSGTRCRACGVMFGVTAAMPMVGSSTLALPTFISFLSLLFSRLCLGVTFRGSVVRLGLG